MGTPAAPAGTAADKGAVLWRRCPGWIFNMALSLVLAGGLVVMSNPIEDFDAWMIFAVALLFLAGAWVVRIGAYLFHITRRADPPWRLLIAPAMVSAFILICSMNLPVRARFALSRGSFDEAVQRLDRGEQMKAQRLGLYGVEEPRPFETDGWLFTTGSGFIFTDGGFAYIRTVDEELARTYHLVHVDDQWWTWYYAD